MKLYEIDPLLERLLELPDGNSVDSETGEVFTKEALDAIEMERSQKIENLLLFYKNTIAEAEAIEAEAKRQHERYQQKKNKALRAKEYAAFILAGEKFETSKVAARFTKRKSCVIDDETKIPDQFFKVKKDVSKTDLTNWLKQGNAVEGAHLEEKSYITVK